MARSACQLEAIQAAACATIAARAGDDERTHRRMRNDLSDAMQREVRLIGHGLPLARRIRSRRSVTTVF